MQNQLLELLHTNPFLSHLDFSRRSFTVIDQASLQLLTRFTELRRIDFSENLIRHLPHDLSILCNILEFDLNGNPLENLEAAVDSLACMPSLRRLRINLHEEEQVDYLLRNLENLEELNGLAVEREALFNDEAINNDDEEDHGEEMYQMDGGAQQQQMIMEGESMMMMNDQYQSNAIEEEGEEGEEDDFINPSNIVLEESNEDGTMSNENPGSGGRQYQRIGMQNSAYRQIQENSFAAGGNNYALYEQESQAQDDQQHFLNYDDQQQIAEEENEEEFDCDAVGDESQQLQKSMNSMMISNNENSYNPQLNQQHMINHHQRNQIIDQNENQSQEEESQIQQQTNNLDTSSAFEVLNQSAQSQNQYDTSLVNTNSLSINDESSELKHSDLENIAVLYESIRQVIKRVDRNIDQRMANDFDSNLKNVMQILSNNLQEIQELNSQQSQSNPMTDYQKQAFERQLDTMKKRVILSTKKALLSICYDKALYYLRAISGEPLCQNLYEIFMQLQTIESRLLDSSLNVMSHCVTDQIQRLLASTQQSLNGSNKPPMRDNAVNTEQSAEINQLRAQLQMKDQQMYQLQSQLQSNKQETQEVIEAADVMEKEYSSKQQELERDIKDLKEHNSNLEEENKRIMDTLVRHSKAKATNNVAAAMGITSGGEIVRSVSSSSITQSSRMPLAFQQHLSNQHNPTTNPTSVKNSHSQLPQKINTILNQNSTQQSQATIHNPNLYNQSQQPSNTSQPNLLAPSIHTQQSSIQVNTPSLPGPNQSKILPLKQLKDIITDMEQQKIKYDSKCRESGLPIETMEQFMYTYLNQKYGLKSLIIEWASTIIHSIKVYLRDDHQVTLFAKILKNECDEEFRFIQTHVRDTLGNLLKILLREKYHLKSEAEIAQMCETIQTSTQGVIEDIYWKKIVNKMYDKDDVHTLTTRFMECVNARKQLSGFSSMNSSIMPGSNMGSVIMKENKSGQISQNSTIVMPLRPAKLTREDEIKLKKQQKTTGKLLYADFVKVILDFQLQEHEKFLSSFTQLFKDLDTDGNGILNEEEFRDLLSRMNQVTQTCTQHEQLTEHIDTLLNIVDPHNNKQMTYSEIVQLLSSQMTPISDENPRMVPLLEKYVNQIQILRGIQDPPIYHHQLQEEENEEDEQQLQDKYFEMFGGGAIGTTNSTNDHQSNNGGRYSDHPIANIRSANNMNAPHDGNIAQNWIIDTHNGGQSQQQNRFNSDLEMVQSNANIQKQKQY